MSGILVHDQTVRPPFDKYWDAPLTRREAQQAFNKLGANDSELMGMADTASILINYICENLNIKREDVELFVIRKTEELKKKREAAKAEAEKEATNNAVRQG